jgi:hypothetical protein
MADDEQNLEGEESAWKPVGEEVRADQVHAKSITWLDEEELGERIPLGMLTLVGGRPGQGKSIWSADIAARISKKGWGVIFSNLEDPLSQVVRPRLEAAGADLSKVHFWNPTLPRDSETLRTMIYALQAKLVVIDPVAAHLTVSIYNDQEVRQALKPLSQIAAETGCAIILITHTLKSVRRGSHPLEAIGGSGGGLPGAARVVYIWGPDPDEPSLRALGAAKMNIAQSPPALVYEFDEQEWIVGEKERAQVIRTGKLVLISDAGQVGLEYATELAIGTGKGVGEISPEKKAIAAEWLTHYLAAGARAVKELREDAAQQGISWATLRRASEEVGVQKARHGFGPGSYIEWMLPDGHHALLTPEESESVDETVRSILQDLEAMAANTTCCDKPDIEERLDADGKPEYFCSNCQTIIGTQERLPGTNGEDA